MKEKQGVALSPAFRKQAGKAVAAILLFVICYLLILLLAVALTMLCVAGGIFLIALRPMFLTIALGIGLASLGVLVLIFLLKFLFKKNIVDRSHLVELKPAEEPALFSMINSIADEVGTTYPKKVYLSTEVNASVFYDSGFWSMFLPIRKNLQIGLGLVNSVTREELRSILAHEFGHFSQRSMKVGSYVYNVNKVIFDMLYDNSSYQRLVERWGNTSGYFSIFVAIAVQIIQGIQWMLRQLYQVVNVNYLGLSREMEFHADEIAASVTGYEPLQHSLLRLSLADNAFTSVLRFYDEKVSSNQKTDNLYRDHAFVIRNLGESNRSVFLNNLPLINLEEQSRFNKSKLTVGDQWASHPSPPERIERLRATGISQKNKEDAPANTLFTNIETTQKLLTGRIFEAVNYKETPATLSAESFQQAYMAEQESTNYSKLYSGYYDFKQPNRFSLELPALKSEAQSVPELFSDSWVDQVYTAIAMQGDIETMQQIEAAGSIKTFDYDGKRYRRSEIEELKAQLKIELDALNEKITQHDALIYQSFFFLEQQLQIPAALTVKYSDFFAYNDAFDSKYELYAQLMNGLSFVAERTSYEQIRLNFDALKPVEEKLKQELSSILLDPLYEEGLNDANRQRLGDYINNRNDYFSGTVYNDKALELLYAALRTYVQLLQKGFRETKRRLCHYQAQLFEKASGTM